MKAFLEEQASQSMFAEMGIFKHLSSVNLVWSLPKQLESKVICMHIKLRVLGLPVFQEC